MWPRKQPNHPAEVPSQDVTMQFDQELARRWSEFNAPEAVEARRVRRLQREAELKPLFGGHRYAAISADFRASLEVFCEQRILLPYNGLMDSDLGTWLWEAGFYWQAPSSGRPKFLPTLFPAGWQFVPYELDIRQALEENDATLHMASLRGPQGEWPADVHYMLSADINPAIETGNARLYVK